MSTLSSANVTDVNLVLKERTHMHLCLNMLIFTHNLGNWLIHAYYIYGFHGFYQSVCLLLIHTLWCTSSCLCSHTWSAGVKCHPVSPCGLANDFTVSTLLDSQTSETSVNELLVFRFFLH